MDVQGRVERLERAVDELDTRVSTTEALALLPQRIDDLREDLSAVRRDQQDERRLAHEFRRDMWKAIAAIKNEQSRRFDRVDKDHKEARGTDWKAVITLFVGAASGIGVPFALVELVK